MIDMLIWKWKRLYWRLRGWDDGGRWYSCSCGMDWQAPDHPNPKACPECDE